MVKLIGPAASSNIAFNSASFGALPEKKTHTKKLFNERFGFGFKTLPIGKL
jgi:hypothetical protein